ncbi:MAG: helix-turn-helix domain-containing protein [Firmicutes bacterium]|nr:helix-turn-helix domain-containing protein [Bacillota bacterium]
MTADDEFILRLGQSRADRMMQSFSMIHDETAFDVTRATGAEGFALYFILNSYTHGRCGVTAFPSNEKLAERIGVSVRTIQRWKQRLVDAAIIRVADCYLSDGTQTSNVIIFNAAYPDVPVGWDDFAPNGFVRHPNQLPVPITLPLSDESMRPKKPRKIWGDKNVMVVKHGVTKLSGYQNGPRQNCHGSQTWGDKTVRVVKHGATKLSSPPLPTSPVVARSEGRFLRSEPNQLEVEEEVVVAVPDRANRTDYVETVKQEIGRRLNRDVLGSDELAMITEMQTAGIALDTILQGIRETATAFRPRYEGDRIKRATYFRDRILELHELSHARAPHSNIHASSPGLRRPPDSRTQSKLASKRRSPPDRATPAAQPGKYDRFYELLAKRKDEDL